MSIFDKVRSIYQEHCIYNSKSYVKIMASTGDVLIFSPGNSSLQKWNGINGNSSSGKAGILTKVQGQ